MTDDPRDILKAAGAECAEVEDGYTHAPCTWDRNYAEFDNTFVYKPAADAAILALARLVAKYKWQRDECADELGRKLAADYKYEATKPFAANDVMADLNGRWERHCK